MTKIISIFNNKGGVGKSTITWNLAHALGIQNKNVPFGELENYEQVVSLQDRKKWAPNQIEQIQLLKSKFSELASNVIRICV